MAHPPILLVADPLVQYYSVNLNLLIWIGLCLILYQLQSICDLQCKKVRLKPSIKIDSLSTVILIGLKNNSTKKLWWNLFYSVLNLFT